MSLAVNGPIRSTAECDPLVRRHLVLVALALHAAGRDADDAELVGHIDPRALEALVHTALGSATGELLLRYLRALTPEQCRILVRARNRLELELPV